MKKQLVSLLLAGLAACILFPACQKDLPPVEIEMEADPLGGSAPLDVNARCTVISGQVTDYNWDFGDGGSASGSAAAFHRYTKAGTYTLRLTVTGYEGSEKNPYTVTKVAETTISVYQPNVPPVAGFLFSPTTAIIADKTNVKFNNTTTGTATAWQWDFGASESGSSSQTPTYQFNYAGTKTIRLTASGPLGSNSITKTLTVHAMDPACHNYTGGATQSASAIQYIRNNSQQKIGLPIFQNNYSGSVHVEFFRADDWMNGKYTPYGYWTIKSSTTNQLVWSGGTPINIGNDWGVRVSFTNGVVSCIRTVKDVSTYSGGKLTMVATKVYEGL